MAGVNVVLVNYPGTGQETNAVVINFRQIFDEAIRTIDRLPGREI
jgi:hypothetical protein